MGGFRCSARALFDMASDGKNFTLVIPSKNKAVKGSNSVKKKSANQLENLRPGFFLDAMVVRGLEPDDLLFGGRGFGDGGGRGQEAPVTPSRNTYSASAAASRAASS